MPVFKSFLSSKVFLIIRKIGAYILVAGTLLFIIAGSIALVYENDVKSFFLVKLNQSLNTKVEIAEIELSIWRSFPDASLILHEVKVHHAKPYQGAGYFLTANEISFRFSWFDFISKNYSAKRIDIKQGGLNILTSLKGEENFNILKQSSDSTSGAFEFSIEALDVYQIDVHINHEPSEFETVFLIDDAYVNGEFSKENYELGIESELVFDFLNSGTTRWISKKNIDLNCLLNVNNEQKLYEFTNGKIALAQLKFGIAGNIQLTNEAPLLNLNLNGIDLDIASFLSLLPDEYKKSLEDYDSEGTFYADVFISGAWGSNENPQVKGSFGIKDGDINYKPNDLLMKRVQVNGDFSNGEAHSLKTSILNLKQFAFELNGGIAEGELQMNNFDNVYIKSKFKAKLSLSDVADFFPQGKVSDLKGKAELDIDIEGALGKILMTDGILTEKLNANGFLKLENASFKITGDTLTYRNIDSRIRFSKYDVFVEEFSGFAGSTDYNANGSLINLFGYLFTTDQPLGIKAKVQSKKVNLDELFTNSAEGADNDEYNLKISQRLNLKLNIRIDQLNFRKFKSSGIVGDISLRDKVFTAERLRFRTMDGLIELDGVIDGSAANQFKLTCHGNLKNVNINQLFLQCENFGQNVITEQNIMGKLDAKVDLSFPMDSTLSIDTKRLRSVCDITINDGRLISFEPLNNLSKFISIDELKDVRFSTLENTIEIENEKVIIPKMEIISSALNIFVSGKHGFDNMVDYHFQLTMSDLLSKKAKKAKKENEEFGIIADDGLGRTQLFISMSGPIDDPKISYDALGAKEKFKADIKNEKQTLKKVLKEELGLFKKDSTLNDSKKKKEKKVIIEFDE